MKVVILQDYLRCGGTENQSIFLHNFLNSEGIDAHLIVFRGGGRLKKRVQNPEKLHTLQNSMLNWYAPKIISTLNEIGPDRVILMGRNANLYGWFLKKKLTKNSKFISTMRSGRSLPFLYKWTLKSCDQTLVNSQYALELLRESKIETNAISMIHNAYLYNRSSKRNEVHERDDFIILNLGAFVPGKNHRAWIPICKELQSLMTGSFKIWLLGEGAEWNSFRKLVQKENLEDTIVLHGYKENPIEFYNQADLAVSVSLEESLPNFLVEAQYNGLPVISYDTAGCKECFKDKKSGFLVPKNDYQRVCFYIKKFANDQNLMESMKSEALEFSEQNFSPSVIGQKFIQVLEES